MNLWKFERETERQRDREIEIVHPIPSNDVDILSFTLLYITILLRLINHEKRSGKLQNQYSTTRNRTQPRRGTKLEWRKLWCLMSQGHFVRLSCLRRFISGLQGFSSSHLSLQLYRWTFDVALNSQVINCNLIAKDMNVDSSNAHLSHQ